jgi:hypothetical protein
MNSAFRATSGPDRSLQPFVNPASAAARSAPTLQVTAGVKFLYKLADNLYLDRPSPPAATSGHHLHRHQLRL